MNGKEPQQPQSVGKFSLFTAGLHNKILIDSDLQQNISPPKQISARSKLSTNGPFPPPSQQQQQQQQQQLQHNLKPKPKRPSSANPRVRSAHQHQHREPGKIQKNHPILNNPHQGAVKRTEPEYEGRNFAVLNKLTFSLPRLLSLSYSASLFFLFREELLETLTEIKKQQKNSDILIAQLRADNQRSLFSSRPSPPCHLSHSCLLGWKEKSQSNSIALTNSCLLNSRRTATSCSRSEKKLRRVFWFDNSKLR
jgi:hypothetical protein